MYCGANSASRYHFTGFCFFFGSFVTQNSFTLEASLCGPDIGRRYVPRLTFDTKNLLYSSLCGKPEPFFVTVPAATSTYRTIFTLAFASVTQFSIFGIQTRCYTQHAPITRDSAACVLHKCVCDPAVPSSNSNAHVLAQSHFNAVLQELLSSGDSMAEGGGGDSDSADGRLVPWAVMPHCNSQRLI